MSGLIFKFNLEQCGTLKGLLHFMPFFSSISIIESFCCTVIEVSQVYPSLIGHQEVIPNSVARLDPHRHTTFNLQGKLNKRKKSRKRQNNKCVPIYLLEYRHWRGCRRFGLWRDIPRRTLLRVLRLRRPQHTRTHHHLETQTIRH